VRLQTDLVRVLTDRGPVAGVQDRDAVRFRGIPYAAAPFGVNRFRPPQPVSAWDGVRDASEFGVGAPQAGFPGDPFNGYYNPSVQGEDCLNLDVWTPDPGTSGLPVMVWIHGGGFITGTGSAPAHDGYTFARDGIVHVGINYRLGIDGFTYFGEGSENRGLLDMIAALDWVQRNITNFGGNPDNVTIYGQSAGAIAVFDLLVMPCARGLFARGIAMSGAPAVGTDIEGALRVTDRLAARFGVLPTLEAFAQVSLGRTIDETLPMEFEFLDWNTWGADSFLVTPYRGVWGTEAMRQSPMQAAGEAKVPLMAGTLRNEATGFLTGLGMLESMTAETAAQMMDLMGADERIQRCYRDGPRGLSTPIQLAEAVWTDFAFRMPTLDLVDRWTQPTHVYEFTWESPFFPPKLGSNHALEGPFMRDDLAAMYAIGPAGQALLGPDAPQTLADDLHRAFVRYATDGEPGWSAYDEVSRSTMVFDTNSAVQNDPAAMERRAWKESK